MSAAAVTPNLFSKFGVIGLGCMSLSGAYGRGLADDEAVHFVKEALRLGVRYFDTAAIYDRTTADLAGTHHGHNEAILGRTFAETIAEGLIKREDICIATKCGINDDFTLDLKPEHIERSCMESLERLGIEKVDLFYLHRPPGSEDFDGCMEALATLLHEAKIAHIGLSEFSAIDIRRAHTYFEALKTADPEHFPYNPLKAVETEFSIFSIGPLNNGVIATCSELDLSFFPYGSLGRGLLLSSIHKDFEFTDGDIRAGFPRFQEPNFSANLALRDQLLPLAETVGCSLEQLALAWSIKVLEAQACTCTLIPGTTNLDRLRANLEAAAVVDRLDDDIMTRIREIAPKGAFGARYSDDWRSMHRVPPSPPHEFSPSDEAEDPPPIGAGPFHTEATSSPPAEQPEGATPEA